MRRIFLAALALWAGTAFAAPVMTPFDPATQGFRFVNTFVNEIVPGVDIHTSGLCGGMTYAALDYYNAKRAIPDQDWRPANGTLLQQYLYARQVDSIVANVSQWTGDLKASAAHVSRQIAALRSYIDRGVPVPLGLRSAAGWNMDHQVLAIGYDLGAGPQDLRIFLCDPNFPGKTMRLVPGPGRHLWVERDERGVVIQHQAWQTWFVDRNYRAKTPPPVPDPHWPDDGKVHQLLLSIRTGGHHLAGGDDNVDLTVNLADGTSQSYPNISLSARWIANYEETAAVTLATAVAPGDIRGLVLTAHVGDGRWDVRSVRVRARGGGRLDLPDFAQAGPHTFTAAAPQLAIPVPQAR